MLGQQLINGIMLGSVYGLAGLGLTLIYAVMKFINLAHGQTIVVAAYLGYVAALYTGNIAITVAVWVIGGAVVGLLLHKLFFERVRQQEAIVPLMVAIGLGTMMEEALRMGFYGGRPTTFPTSVQMSEFVELGVARISYGHLLGLGITLVVMAMLYYLLHRSKLGRGLRATAENAPVAQLLGVNDRFMASLTFVIAGGLAGVSGVMYGLVYAGLSPYLSATFTFKAMAIVLFAGAGNIYGAVAAGLILGLVEVSSVVLGLGGWRDMFTFGLIILVLVFRPSGLFGSIYGE